MRRRHLTILFLILLGGLCGCVGPVYDVGPYRSTYSSDDNPLPGYLYGYPSFGYGRAYYWGPFYRSYHHHPPLVIHYPPRHRHPERPFIGKREVDWRRGHNLVEPGRSGHQHLRHGSDRQIVRERPAWQRQHLDSQRSLTPDRNSGQLRGRGLDNSGERYSRDGRLSCRGPRC
jgi:hypothetical protein